MTNLITKIKKTVGNSDIKSTKNLLKKLKNQSLEIKLEVLQTLALAPDMVALNLLPLLTQDEYIDKEIYIRVIQLITDRAHLNFHFSLCLYNTHDKKIILQITPLMKHILSKETDFEILKETIKTAGKYKIESLVNDVAEFIFYAESTLKAEAVKALERIGTDAALHNLSKAADSSKCDQNILEAIEVLKNQQKEGQENKDKKKNNIKKKSLKNLSKWNEKLKSKDIETRFNALIQLAEAGSDSIDILIENLKSKDHDLIINSLDLISRIIPKKILPEIFSLLENKKIDEEIKFAVYAALDSFPQLESTASVIEGASHPAMHVRTAAVTVLDKNPTDLIFAQIKETIESGTETGKKLGESILDAHADNIINQLSISDAFTYILSNYLEKRASFSVLENYINIQKKRNLAATSRKWEKIVKERQKEDRLTVLIISASQIRINIYTKSLFAAGYLPKAFLDPQAAFESLMFDKPFVVISDLFLHNMTGLIFLKEIREIHAEKELPVIFSTLQNDFIDQEKNIIGFPLNINKFHHCFKNL